MPLGGNSSITQQIWYTHWVILFLDPPIVTVLSVEFGKSSEATWTLAPVTSLISLILAPPLPIRLPHCDAGTINFKDEPELFDLEELDADDDLPLFSPE